jgi:hypothetical protein
VRYAGFVRRKRAMNRIWYLRNEGVFVSKREARVKEPGANGRETTQESRKALLVLGMHRSGTSALAGLFAHLGARAPESLLETTEWNPKGYWESEKIKHFNDRVLAHVGGSWRDWRALTPAWEESLLESAFSDELLETIDGEFGNANLLVVKDPRICRLAPFWVTNLRRMGIEPMAVLPLRNPLEVASSLAQRNGFPIGTSLLLWLRHSLDAELATRDMPRSFQRYDDLLNDWRVVACRVARDLNFDWPHWSSETERQIDEFIAIDLRHHRLPREGHEESKLIAGWVEKTYRYLSALVDGVEDSDEIRNGLDAVREEFDRTSPIFASIFEFYERQEQSWKRETWKLKGLISRKTLELSVAGRRELNIYRRLDLQKTRADDEKSRREKLEKAVGKYRFMIGVLESVAQVGQRIMTASLDDFLPWRRRSRRHRSGEATANALIRKANLFDDEWYIAEYPDVVATGMEPLTHYLRFGVHEGRNPNPYFDTEWYLQKYPDVAGVGANPLLHFVKLGAMEERDPGPNFSTLSYLTQHPELVLSQTNPLGHFLRHKGE